MNDMNFTKKDIKAIKRGIAYKTWNRKRRNVILASLIWMIGGIVLLHINSFTSAIYSIGLVICVIAIFYSVKFSCWKCPTCKKKLSSKLVYGGTATVIMPILVKKCPHCEADLTKWYEAERKDVNTNLNLEVSFNAGHNCKTNSKRW